MSGTTIHHLKLIGIRNILMPHNWAVLNAIIYWHTEPVYIIPTVSPLFLAYKGDKKSLGLSHSMSRPPTSSDDVNSIPIAESLNTGTSLTTIRHHTSTDSLQGFNNNQPEFLAHNITPLESRESIWYASTKWQTKNETNKHTYRKEGKQHACPKTYSGH
jgi:hypothetical protein